MKLLMVYTFLCVFVFKLRPETICVDRIVRLFDLDDLHNKFRNNYWILIRKQTIADKYIKTPTFIYQFAPPPPLPLFPWGRQALDKKWDLPSPLFRS